MADQLTTSIIIAFGYNNRNSSTIFINAQRSSSNDTAEKSIVKWLI